MKTKNSRIRLCNVRSSKPLDVLHSSTKELSFMMPKRVKIFEIDDLEYSALQNYYACRDGFQEAIISRNSIVWERMASDGMIFGSRLGPLQISM